MEAFIYSQFLLQRNEARRMSGSNTRTTVFNRLVCDGELSKVMTNHLRLKNRQNTPLAAACGSCEFIIFIKKNEALQTHSFTMHSIQCQSYLMALC